MDSRLSFFKTKLRNVEKFFDSFGKMLQKSVLTYEGLYPYIKMP